jgi:hypothetical protein
MRRACKATAPHVLSALHDARHTAPLPAHQALARIGQLYEIERACVDLSAEERRAIRQRDAIPLLKAFGEFRSHTSRMSWNGCRPIRSIGWVNSCPTPGSLLITTLDSRWRRNRQETGMIRSKPCRSPSRHRVGQLHATTAGAPARAGRARGPFRNRPSHV